MLNFGCRAEELQTNRRHYITNDILIRARNQQSTHHQTARGIDRANLPRTSKDLDLEGLIVRREEIDKEIEAKKSKQESYKKLLDKEVKLDKQEKALSEKEMDSDTKWAKKDRIKRVKGGKVKREGCGIKRKGTNVMGKRMRFAKEDERSFRSRVGRRRAESE